MIRIRAKKLTSSPAGWQTTRVIPSLKVVIVHRTFAEEVVFGEDDDKVCGIPVDVLLNKDIPGTKFAEYRHTNIQAVTGSFAKMLVDDSFQPNLTAEYRQK